MTRNGKIARLPKAIRDQLNHSLEDGVPGIKLVDWLNMLPEVRQIMADHFEGRDINEVNLSEWKAGGFLDWQARRDMHAHAVELMEEAQDLKQALPSLPEHLSMVVAGRYAELLNKWNGEVDEAFMKKLKGLRLLCQDVAVLRREERQTERLALQQKQWDNAMRCEETKAVELCLDESKEYPEAADLYRKAFATLRDYREGRKKNETYLAAERKRREEKEELARQAWLEKHRLEEAEKKRQQDEETARFEARKARWQAAHPGQDPQAGKWWAWQPEEMTKQE